MIFIRKIDKVNTVKLNISGSDMTKILYPFETLLTMFLIVNIKFSPLK